MVINDRLPKADMRPSAVEREGFGGVIEGRGLVIDGSGYCWPNNDG